MAAADDKTSYLHTPTSTPFSSLTLPQCLDAQAEKNAAKEAYVVRATGLDRAAITFGQLKEQVGFLFIKCVSCIEIRCNWEVNS